MTDLDFRPPPSRPAPVRLRADIADSLHQAARRHPADGPRRAVKVLVAAAVALLVLVGAAVVAVHLRAPEPSAPGPIGTLDVRRLTPDETRAQLAGCVATIERDPDQTAATALPSDPAAWTPTYARVQHLRGSAPGTSASVLWARHGDAALRCVDGRYDSWITPASPAGTVTSALEDSPPALSCTADRTGSDPVALLFATTPAVRTVRIRLVMDGQPGRWQTTGAEGGLASVPVLEASDFTRLRSARAVGYQVQALDAAAGLTPIASLWHPAGVTTYTRQLPTCADQAGTGEQPRSDAAGDTECARLVNAATWDDEPIGVLARSAGPSRFLSVVGDDRNPTLCSLWPVRAVRSVATNAEYDGQSATADQAHRLSFSAFDRGRRGVVVVGGGRLGPTTASITYTFPGGKRVPAEVAGGYWTLSYVRDAPFLDGRPLSQLPPAEVDVVATDGTRSRYTVPFPAVTGCDHDLVLPEQTC